MSRILSSFYTLPVGPLLVLSSKSTSIFSLGDVEPPASVFCGKVRTDEAARRTLTIIYLKILTCPGSSICVASNIINNLINKDR